MKRNTLRSISYILVLILFIISNPGYSQVFPWLQTSGPFGGNVRAMVINNEGDIFAGAVGGGVFRSTDNGNNWSPINNGLTNKIVRALAIKNNGDIFTGTLAGAFRSTNNGVSWSPINNGLNSSSVLAFTFNSSGDIFAGASGGVYRSTDNGNNWSSVNSNLSSVVALATNSSGDIFAASFSGGVYRSTDNGDNWDSTNNGLPSTLFNTFSINSSDDIFVGTYAGVYRSTDNGDNWSETNTGLPLFTSVNGLVINGTGDIFAGTDAGVYHSTDNGDNWSEINTGLTNTSVNTFAINGNNNIFAGTGGGVFRSIDNGDNWSQTNNGLIATTVNALAEDDSSTIFAGTNNGVFYSTDNGVSWISTNLTNVVVNVITRKNNGDFFAGTPDGVYRSTDNGDNWSETNTGLPSFTTVNGFAINSSGDIFAGTSSGVFLTTDNGNNWNEINNGLTNTFVNTININSTGNIFAGTNDGVFRSTDNGDNWGQINMGLTNTLVNALLINSSDHIFAGTNGGVFRSTNNGDNWSEINTGLPITSVNAFAISSLNQIFAGTFNGVFQSVDNGDNWGQINTGLTNTSILSLAISSGGEFFAPKKQLLSSEWVGALHPLFNFTEAIAGTDGGGVFINILATEKDPFNFNFDVNHVNYLHFTPPSPVGLITVNFTPGKQGVYLNVFARNNNNQLSSLILKNLFLPSIRQAEIPTEFSTTFDFTTISTTPFENQFNLNLFAYITETPELSDEPPPDVNFIDITTVEVTSIDYDAFGVEVSGEPEETTQVPVNEHTTGDTPIVSVYRPDPGNLDLNSSEYPPTGSYAGDRAACVPTATANSMKWMERHYKKIDLPDDMDLRKTMETLSRLMIRETERGVEDNLMIRGKLDFMEQYELPVEVKFQAKFIDGNITSISGNSTARNFNDQDNKRPKWEFLKKMIEDGEDVEINYTWTDENGQWLGHSVNLTAIQEFKSGVKKITFKHDTQQGSQGGLKQEVYEVNIDENGWMRFGPYTKYYIKTVVAESPVASFGERAAGYLNEFLTTVGLLKTNSASAIDEFIEVIAKQNIPDLQKYRITVYNSSGEQNVEITLDEFTAGASVDSFTVYTYTFSGDVLPDSNGAIGLAFSGSPIEESFISWGGSITAVNGDFTSLASTDIGITAEAGHSFALSGNGIVYQDFTWVSSPTPTPGELNPNQTLPVELASFITPVKYELMQNYPNPFNPSTKINYSIPQTSFVNLRVYNILGKEIETLVNEEKQAGFYEIEFNTNNLSSGVYFYRIQSGDFVQTKKMILLR